MTDDDPSLVEKIIDVHDALHAAGIPHVFGGALALAFHVHEPRTTNDIDVNVCARADEAQATLRALPPGVDWNESTQPAIERDDQVRLWWGRSPVDLFFRASDFHDELEERAVWRDLAGRTLPFLAADDLTIFKALFNRPKDWIDIEAMVQAGSVDLATVIGTLDRLIGDDPRLDRLESLR